MTIETNWKLKSPQKKKKIETKDEAEAARYKAAGYLQKKLKSGKIILEKKFQKWELFQENVRIFLEALSFGDTESGHASWLGRYQIDVVGGHDGTFLVFECKSKNQPGIKKTVQEININSAQVTPLKERSGMSLDRRSQASFGIYPLALPH